MCPLVQQGASAGVGEQDMVMRRGGPIGMDWSSPEKVEAVSGQLVYLGLCWHLVAFGGAGGFHQNCRPRHDDRGGGVVGGVGWAGTQGVLVVCG